MGFFLGDVMYALGMNTTKKVCVGLGQTDEEGKKFAKFDDIVEKVNAAKNTPDSSGTYHDYVELLKLYDKNSNGTMMLAELENILANLGDEIPKEDVQKLLLSFVTLRMRTDSSPTCHSWTDCAARPKHQNNINHSIILHSIREYIMSDELIIILMKIYPKHGSSPLLSCP